MNPVVPSDRRARRHHATKAEIVAAAWDLVRENGLASLAMRDLGARVEMTAQSLYLYFGSKNAIFDAMFREGYEAFIDAMNKVEALDAGDERASDPGAQRKFLRAVARSFFDFCTSDPVRYQLLFQRTIPGFVPTPESYAVALRSYEAQRARLRSFGFDGADDFDLVTAVLTGLTDQQISNDPGGDRWKKLVDRSVDMLIANVALQPKPLRARRSRR